MKALITAAIVIGLLFTAISCKQRAEENDASSVYSEDSAMAHYLVEPDRAIALLDSAVIVHNITPQRADYLKAIVMYDGKNDADSCIAICQKLIEERAWEALPDSSEALSFHVDVLRLMATSSNETGNLLTIIRCANEGAKLAHGHANLLGDEADFLSRMGYVMCQVGQTDEGFAAMQRAEQLSQKDNTWSSLITYLNNSKKQYYSYNKIQQYEKAKKVVLNAIHHLDNAKNRISKIKYAPEGIVNDPEALEEFLQYYHLSFDGYLAHLYAIENDRQSAEQYLEKLEKNPQWGNASKLGPAIDTYILLGRYEDAANGIEAVKSMMGADTLSYDYFCLLQSEMELARKRGEEGKMSDLAQRIISVSDSVSTRNIQVVFADAAAQYHLQDEQLRRKDAEEKLLVTFIIIGAVVLVVCVILVIIYIRKLVANRKMALEELNQLQDALAEDEEAMSIDLPVESIFQKAEEYVIKNKSFCDPKYNILMLSREIATNRSYLSVAINTMTGMNFRKWLAKHRVEYAKALLLEDPDITIDKLTANCGFDNRMTLYRQFKNFVGMTPNEWMERETFKN